MSESLRRRPPIDLFLVRHVEAVKNVENRSGGGPQELTAAGIARAQQIGDYFSHTGALSEARGIIVHQPERRCLDTALQIQSVTRARISEEQDFAGVGLGQLGGLSREELRRLYPEVADSQEAWRRGKPLAGSYVPGMERLPAFATRLRRGLDNVLDDQDRPDGPVVLVGSTSVLNMLTHLLSNDGELNVERYGFTDFELGEIRGWRVSDVPTHRLTLPRVPEPSA